MSLRLLLPMFITAAAPAQVQTFDMTAHAVILTVHASGAQLYECKLTNGSLAWVFREPIAALIEDGKTVGRHYAGPHWALDDGSVVRGKQAASKPGESNSDVPQLKLDIVENLHVGALAAATVVYRTDTHGGALAGPCQTIGDIKAVPYAAAYVFAR